MPCHRVWDATSGTGADYPSREHELIFGFYWGSIFSFLCSVLQVIVCPLSVSNFIVYRSSIFGFRIPFGIFKLFLDHFAKCQLSIVIYFARYVRLNIGLNCAIGVIHVSEKVKENILCNKLQKTYHTVRIVPKSNITCKSCFFAALFRFAGYSLYISNSSTTKTDGYLCNQHIGPNLPSKLENVSCNHLGRNVIIYNERDETGNNIPSGYSLNAMLELCEVEVYGK